jgi:hypothetical protein
VAQFRKQIACRKGKNFGFVKINGLTGGGPKKA